MKRTEEPGHESTGQPASGAAAGFDGMRGGLAAAVVLAAFLHLLLFWATPAEVFPPSTGKAEPAPVLEVQLEPIPEEPEVEETYVRAAPEVPEEAPEETANISDRDQRAAQPEEALPDPQNTPQVEGDEEISNRLVQGNPSERASEPSPPAASQNGGESPMPRMEAAPRAQEEARPPRETIQEQPQQDKGLAAENQPQPEQTRPELTEDPERQRELAEAVPPSPRDGRGQDQMTTPEQAAGNPGPRPRPRQRVERETSYGPIKDNRQGAVRVGRLAFDARYSEFGEYWRRVAEVIEVRWRNLVRNTRSIPLNGNRVVVQFFITRKGQVKDVQIGFSDAGRLAETISMDAILAEAPYFEWTPEMIVKMGERAPCAIHFYY